MTPAHRAAIRQGVNLVTLPDEVRAELAAERAACLVRDVEAKRRAAELFEIRHDRVKVHQALSALGDLAPAVRAELNRLIERRKQ